MSGSLGEVPDHQVGPSAVHPQIQSARPIGWTVGLGSHEHVHKECGRLEVTCCAEGPGICACRSVRSEPKLGLGAAVASGWLGGVAVWREQSCRDMGTGAVAGEGSDQRQVWSISLAAIACATDGAT